MDKQYFGPPFYFCTSNNPNFIKKTCDGNIIYEEPKKVKVFKKQETTMSKKEFNSWITKFRYR